MSMEKIRRLNSARDISGARFGETSRCDMLEEERSVGHITRKRRTEAIVRDSVAKGTSSVKNMNALSKPKLAKSHTKSNVCVHRPSLRISSFFMRFCFLMCRCQKSSVGSMFLE